MLKNAAYTLIGGNNSTDPDVEASTRPAQDDNRSSRVQELPMRRITSNQTASLPRSDSNQNETQDESDAFNENITLTPQQTLYKYARLGDAEGMNDILSQPGIEINLKNKQNMTALHLAAQNGHEEIAKILLSKGANRYLRDRAALLPLHYAAKSGHVNCVDVLIKGCLSDGHYFSAKDVIAKCKTCIENCKSFDINDPDSEGNTALHYAVKGGYLDIVHLLVNHDASPNTQNKQEITPLHEAARLKSTGCLDVLLSNADADIFQVDNRSRNILHFAATESSGICMKYLLEQNVVKELINKCEGPSGTPLLYAIGCRNLICIDLLLKAGASPSIDNNDSYPIHKAARTALHLACEKLLAKDYSVITEKNKHGQTPLHMAAKCRHIETVDLICKALKFQQLNLSDADDHGQTALHIAVKNSNEKILKRLIDYGITLSKQDSKGFTALHLASSLGKTRCCELLVNKGPSNLYRVDMNGFFPLDLAFQNIDKNHDTIIFLLKKSFCDAHSGIIKPRVSNYFENVKLLKSRMRKYMEKALVKDKREIVEAIIESPLQSNAFSGGKNLQPENFKMLIKIYPDLALKVLGKHIKPESPDQSIFEFTVLEGSYYMEDESSPYDETGKLKVNALEHHKDPCAWVENHPVTHIIINNETELLKHPVTQSWLKNKWRSYTVFLHSSLLFLQGIYLCALVCFMAASWNWVHIGNVYNITKGEFCNASKQLSQEPDPLTSPQNTNHTDIIKKFEMNVNPSAVGFYYFIFVTWIFKVVSEIIYIARLKWVYWRYNNLPHFAIELTQLILTMTLLFAPFGMCYQGRFGLLQEDLAWQCGIFALLCAWLHLISSINQALTSEFLPITKDFLEIFVKVAYFVSTFIIIFAFVFHLLLFDQKAFSSVFQALGSTIVWMLVDLGYTDTFVEKSLSFPILSNLIFFIFITTIGCLLLSLISRERIRKKKGKELDNDYRRLVIYAHLIFRYDICFPSLRRRFAVKEYKYNHKQTNLLESYLGTIENEETTDVKDDIKHMSERLSKVEDLLSDVNEQVLKITLLLSEKTLTTPESLDTPPYPRTPLVMAGLTKKLGTHLLGEKKIQKKN